MASAHTTETAAVIFDLDGVLIDSETIWNRARRERVERSGGTWREEAQREMMGMSSSEWSRYMHEQLGVPMSPEEISATVAGDLEGYYRRRLPLLPGAREAVLRLARRWPLALASSANRPIIELVLDLANLAGSFRATVSSEEVEHGKPAPDVYLAAARALSVAPQRCVAVEDSSNGVRAAAAAAMRVIAIPNAEFPPEAEALACADVVLGSIRELDEGVVERLAPR